MKRCALRCDGVDVFPKKSKWVSYVKCQRVDFGSVVNKG